jgi:hypothetical protein
MEGKAMERPSNIAAVDPPSLRYGAASEQTGLAL